MDPAADHWAGVRALETTAQSRRTARVPSGRGRRPFPFLLPLAAPLSGLINSQEEEILNEAAIKGPYNDKISTIKAEYMSLEEDILRKCPATILSNFIDPEVGFGFGSRPERLRVTPQGRIGYYGFMLSSGKRVSFKGLDLANECQNHFEEHKEKIIEYAKQVQDLSNEQSTILNENRQNKSPELVPINQQRMQLSLEIQDLGALLKDLRGRVAQEKYLGTAPTP